MIGKLEKKIKKIKTRLFVFRLDEKMEEVRQMAEKRIKEEKEEARRKEENFMRCLFRYNRYVACVIISSMTEPV